MIYNLQVTQNSFLQQQRDIDPCDENPLLKAQWSDITLAILQLALSWEVSVNTSRAFFDTDY